MNRYEVTVPLTVHVTVSDDGIIEVEKAEIERGYPGFHSDAEDANGVWNPANRTVGRGRR